MDLTFGHFVVDNGALHAASTVEESLVSSHDYKVQRWSVNIRAATSTIRWTICTCEKFPLDDPLL